MGGLLQDLPCDFGKSSVYLEMHWLQMFLHEPLSLCSFCPTAEHVGLSNRMGSKKIPAKNSAAPAANSQQHLNEHSRGLDNGSASPVAQDKSSQKAGITLWDYTMSGADIEDNTRVSRDTFPRAEELEKATLWSETCRAYNPPILCLSLRTEETSHLKRKPPA